jgi:hypothetical protein
VAPRPGPSGRCDGTVATVSRAASPRPTGAPRAAMAGGVSHVLGEREAVGNPGSLGVGSGLAGAVDRTGWHWLIARGKPLTWAALRAKLTLTTLPLPKTNGVRLAVLQSDPRRSAASGPAGGGCGAATS